MAKGKVLAYVLKQIVLLLIIFSGSNADLDVGFIIDGSGSIAEGGRIHNWQDLLYSVGDVIRKLPEQGTQVGVVVFSLMAELRIKLNNSYKRNLLVDTVHRLHYPRSDTNISGGLYIARTQLFREHNGDRDNAPNVVVLVTDGKSTIDEEKTIPNAQELHRDGIRVICIGIGDEISEEEIRAISSPPHEKDVDYFIRKTFYFSESFISKVVESIEQRQVEMTTPSKTYSGENKGEEESLKSTGINLTSIIIPILIGFTVVVVIIVVILVVHQKKLAKSSTAAQLDGPQHTDQVNNQSGDEDNIETNVYDEIHDQDVTNSSQGIRNDGGVLYDDVAENDPSNITVAGGEGTRGPETTDPAHTYEQLLTRPKALTFASWIHKNNLSESVMKKLKKQKITTISDLTTLTETGIEDLELSIGERSRLRAALKTLMEN